MGSINIDNTGSGSDVTLSSDGTSLLLDGSAVGGGDLITSTSFTSSGFTLTNSDKGKYYHMTGSNQTVTLPASSAISAGWYVFLSLDKGAVYRLDIKAASGDSWYNGETSTYSIYAGNTVLVIYRGSGEWGLIGNDYYMATSGYGSSIRPTAYGARAMAIGAGASASGNYRYAFGKDATATGNLYATAMTRSYASGTDSFAAAIGSNSSSYGAQGTSSIAMGYMSKTLSGTFAVGNTAYAQNSGSYAIGNSATASGINSYVLGTQSTASNTYSMALGRQASTSADYEIALGGTSNFTRSNRTVETIGTDTSGTLQASVGNVFVSTPSANITYTFPTAPASGTAFGFTLNVTPSATVTVTWPASVTWAGGTAPDAPSSGETDVYTFFTTDGGTTWLGFQAGDAMA